MVATLIISVALTGPSEVSSNHPSLLTKDFNGGLSQTSLGGPRISHAAQHQEPVVPVSSGGADQIAEGGDRIRHDVIGRKNYGVPSGPPLANDAWRVFGSFQLTLRGPGSMMSLCRREVSWMSAFRSGYPAGWPCSPSNSLSSYQLAFLFAR